VRKVERTTSISRGFISIPFLGVCDAPARAERRFRIFAIVVLGMAPALYGAVSSPGPSCNRRVGALKKAQSAVQCECHPSLVVS
jgi:hypothetical protein